MSQINILEKDLNPNKSRFRWYHMYFLFAALDIAIILASLFLQHGTLKSFDNLLLESEGISQKQEWIADIRKQLLDLNSYGNNVFGDRDIPKYKNGFHESHIILDNLLKEADKYKVDTAAFHNEVGLMTEAALNVFQLLADKKGTVEEIRLREVEATGFMAQMDQKQAFGMQRLAAIEKDLQDYTHSILNDQFIILKQRQQYEWIFAIFVSISVLCILYFGRRMHKTFNAYMDALQDAYKTIEQEKVSLESERNSLKKVNLELDSFVYTASHDLRAPLRGIASFASILKEDYEDKLDQEGVEYLDRINKGTQRLSHLIDDLLTLSRISRLETPYEKVEIVEILNDILARVEFDIKETKTEIVIQESMPTIMCNKTKLGEVFLNLVNNAIKFSSKNNVEGPRVEIGYKSTDKYHEFYVKDNGIGIDPEFHDQAFKLFQQLNKSKEYEGTGAGLSIVRRVIEDHEGEIRIDSDVGHGATFYFTIPKDLKNKKKIGEILVEDGLISDKQLKEELDKQQEENVNS